MTHQIKKRATGVPVKHAGFHKILEDWKSRGDHDAPSRNHEEFYKDLMENCKEDYDKFMKGELTQEELLEKMNETSEWMLSDDRNEPEATVYYNGDEEDPHTISEYSDDTDGEFTPVWHSTDAWRGYYDIKPSKKWKLLHTDNILAYSEDAQNLEKMENELKDTLQEKGIKFAIVSSRSSNVFSQGLDTFVEAGREKEVEGIAKSLAKKYRDPSDYELTALTGADPSTATKQDRMLVEASHELAKGATPEEAVKKVLKRHG